MKLAAVDVGTNAVRLLLTRVAEERKRPLFQREAFIRMPLRLGEDVFTSQHVSAENTERLARALTGFRALMEAYPAEAYMACATAALREARNGEEVVETVRKRSGLDLQIISGTREAEIVCANHAEGRLKKERSFLYVDVGGGSTDLTFLEEGRSVAMRSFPIGTLRILKRLVRKSHWEELRTWLSEAVAGRGRTAAIGSGGNINKIFKLAKHAEGKPLGIKRIRRVHAFLNKHTLEERIRMLNLRPDRADVIVPAARIYMAVMKWAGIRRIHVPQIGLADGMIHILYEARRAARKDAERDAAGRILTATRG